jgi:hypothetical protein
MAILTLYNAAKDKAHWTLHTGVWVDLKAGGKEKNSACAVN